MTHTSRCASAAGMYCNCSCEGALHGYVSGKFSKSQRRRVYRPISDELDRADRRSRPGAQDDNSHRRAAETRIARDLSQTIERASKLLTAGLINNSLTHEVVVATVEAIVAAEGDTGPRARARASRSVELHLLCTLFCTLCQMIEGTTSGARWTVDRFIGSVILLPKNPHTLEQAAISGVKSAFADHIADQATSLFLTSSGIPDREALRILAIMFCPNALHHRDVLVLETSLVRDLTVTSIEDVASGTVAG